ncbi:MAG: HAMP domain-containing histidine kinase [Endomicrobia bacterium]|nr:HAMP domain-containing histidine kinase [Endomicrobiia bacterium]MCL2145130.1 HAMP domain-containing histidine kinase [Endomicrobiia bacterium]
MNLRLKFTLSVSILLLVVIFFVSYTIFSAQKNFLTLQFEEDRDRSFKVFFHSCEEALKVQEDDQINSIIESIVSIHKPAIVYAAYISRKKNVFTSRDDKNIGSAFTPRLRNIYSPRTERYESLTGENVCEYASPILIGDKYLGTLIVGFSQNYMDSLVQQGISLISGQIKTVAFMALIIGILGANFMAWQLSKPMRLLAQAAKKIGEGDMNVNVDVKRSDEIGVLAKTFNEMIVKVKETDELKDGFVSSVSHELRSPLAAIDGYCDLLMEGVEKNYSPLQQLKGLKIVKDATIRLTNFINNILDLAKMKAGKFEIKAGPVFVDEIIREIALLFESLAVTQNKKLSFNLPNAMPPIYGDNEKIKQVITNLVSNAFKFTKEGDRITLSGMISPSYGNEFVELWVADTGVGLSKHDTEKVFEKFYQVKEGEFKKPKGTGLGLSIVYEIVKLHRGRIWAESELGSGTTFKFVLPIRS